MSHKEACKKWYLKNKEKRKEYSKKWWKRNSFKIKLYRQNLIKKNPSYNKEIYKKNRLTIIAKAKAKRQELKYIVLSHYSNNEQPRCIKCGFQDMRALCIDHIYDDGAEERKIIGGASHRTYDWIIKNNFPPRYQVLCWNCNQIKNVEKNYQW